MRGIIKKLQIRHWLARIVVMVSMVVAPLAATQPAYADSNCFSGDFCMWEHSGSGGWKLEHYPPRYNCVNLPSAYWDQVSSYWNRTGHLITAFPRENCGGLGWDIAGTEYTGSLSWPFNDEMRSYYSY